MAEITFDLDDDVLDPPLITLGIGTPVGEIMVMGTLDVDGRCYQLHGAHLDGPGANRVGLAGLWAIVRAFAEQFDVDEIAIQGAARTTGARPGHVPWAIRWQSAFPVTIRCARRAVICRGVWRW
jgi:hypothetical protein